VRGRRRLQDGEPCRLLLELLQVANAGAWVHECAGRMARRRLRAAIATVHGSSISRNETGTGDARGTVHRDDVVPPFPAALARIHAPLQPPSAPPSVALHTSG
jgi:hypothetical protein